MIPVYVKTSENNILILNGTRDSFRCRQRNKLSNGDKVKPMKFVSYKTMVKEQKKYNKKIYGPMYYESVSKL